MHNLICTSRRCATLFLCARHVHHSVVLAGHAYYFLEDVYPRLTAMRTVLFYLQAMRTTF